MLMLNPLSALFSPSFNEENFALFTDKDYLVGWLATGTPTLYEPSGWWPFSGPVLMKKTLQELEKVWAVFISNKKRVVPLWKQKVPKFYENCFFLLHTSSDFGSTYSGFKQTISVLAIFSKLKCRLTQKANNANWPTTDILIPKLELSFYQS